MGTMGRRRLLRRSVEASQAAMCDRVGKWIGLMRSAGMPARLRCA